MRKRTDPDALQADATVVKETASATGPQMRKKKHWRLLSTLLMIALVAVTLIIIFSDTSIADVWNDVKSVNPSGSVSRWPRRFFPSLCSALRCMFR
jgi:hypothetical protein